jgi:hypothetical protein
MGEEVKVGKRDEENETPRGLRRWPLERSLQGLAFNEVEHAGGGKA